jgi:dTDP-4-dehydrorhamnose 3,5-epimerase
MPGHPRPGPDVRIPGVQVLTTTLSGVLVFVPTPYHDGRGFFARTFDAEIVRTHGIDPSSFTQDSQSRGNRGVLRGLHGRVGQGEAKFVRCAHGAVFDVVVDARPGSPTFGRHQSFRLDDDLFWHLYIPPGLLHGHQVLTDTADVCYRIDRPHDPTKDVSVRYDDADLAIDWPALVSTVSDRDLGAGSWAALRVSLLAGNSA